MTKTQSQVALKTFRFPIDNLRYTQKNNFIGLIYYLLWDLKLI